MNKDEQNPYAAPAPVTKDENPCYSAYVWQVPIVGLATVFQGALETLFSFYLLILFLMLPQMAPGGQATAPNFSMNSLISYFGILGAFLFLLGLARIIVGMYGIHYRKRELGLIVNFAGLLSIASCYCLPSALGVCVYCCIIYLNRDVVDAFHMRSHGETVADIQHHYRR